VWLRGVGLPLGCCWGSPADRAGRVQARGGQVRLDPLSLDPSVTAPPPHPTLHSPNPLSFIGQGVVFFIFKSGGVDFVHGFGGSGTGYRYVLTNNKKPAQESCCRGPGLFFERAFHPCTRFGQGDTRELRADGPPRAKPLPGPWALLSHPPTFCAGVKDWGGSSGSPWFLSFLCAISWSKL
jgi:hypothetical protein